MNFSGVQFVQLLSSFNLRSSVFLCKFSILLQSKAKRTFEIPSEPLLNYLGVNFRHKTTKLHQKLQQSHIEGELEAFSYNFCGAEKNCVPLKLSCSAIKRREEKFDFILIKFVIEDKRIKFQAVPFK